MTCRFGTASRLTPPRTDPKRSRSRRSRPPESGGLAVCVSIAVANSECLLRRRQPAAHLSFGRRRRRSRSGRIRLMQLDVAAANDSRRLEISVAQPDPEPVYADPRLAVVLHPDPERHSKAARPTVDHAFAADVTRVRKRRVHEVPGDIRTSQVSRRVEAVVENVHVPPELAVLASTVSTKIDELSRVAEYEPAAGDEVARCRNEVGTGRTARERPRKHQRYCEQHEDRSTHCCSSRIRVSFAWHLDARLRCSDDDIGQAERIRDVQGVDDDAARRLNLLVQHYIQTGDGNGLVRKAGGRNGHATDREPFDVREADGGSTRNRQSSRYDGSGRDADTGYRHREISERGFRCHLVAPPHRRGVQGLRAEQARDAPQGLTGAERVGGIDERAAVRETGDRPENDCCDRARLTGEGLCPAASPAWQRWNSRQTQLCLADSRPRCQSRQRPGDSDDFPKSRCSAWHAHSPLGWLKLKPLRKAPQK